MIKKIKVAVADDHTLLRQAVATTLELDSRLTVIGQAGDGAELMDLVSCANPDVIVLDLKMPVMDGFAVLKRLQTLGSQCRVVVMGMHFDHFIVAEVIALGARSVLPKNADFNILLNAIIEVFDSGYHFTSMVSHVLAEDMLNGNRPCSVVGTAKLTYREVELLQLICQDGHLSIAMVVENKWGCRDTSIKVLTVETDFALFVPKVFTPNADSRNESFKPSVRGIIKYHFQVFNRWGERLFVTENPEEGWDGFYKGALCQQGSYVWKVVLTTASGEMKEFKGAVILIR